MYDLGITDLINKSRERFGTVLASCWRVVHVDPLPQQVLRLLPQTRGVVKLSSLGDTRVHHRGGAPGSLVQECWVVVLPHQLNQLRQPAQKDISFHFIFISFIYLNTGRPIQHELFF